MEGKNMRKGIGYSIRRVRSLFPMSSAFYIQKGVLKRYVIHKFIESITKKE